MPKHAGMPINQADGDEHARAGAMRLLARARQAPAIARVRLNAAIGDLLLSDEGRLDEQMRAKLAALVAAIVARIEGEIRTTAARALAGKPDLALAVTEGAPALDALFAAGVLRDQRVLAELVGRVRLDHLAVALPLAAPEHPDQPSLLARLSADPNPSIARPALALMAAESRRRTFLDTGRLTRTELPAELHHTLLWLIAAAVRTGVTKPALEIDTAIADAATRSLGAHDEGDSVEAAAMQLAVGINAQPDELGELLAAAFEDRRPALAVAVLARALRIEPVIVRDIVTDSDGAALWLAMRAAKIQRVWLARIGLLLAQADPRRCLIVLPDMVDAAMAIAPDEALSALALWRLPADYRTALASFDQVRTQ